MKEKKIIVILMLIIILLIVIIYTLISTNILNSRKLILKEMSENEQVTNLQTQINNLQTSHTDYTNYIQTCKLQIARAITDMGVTTSDQDTLETMANNIKHINSISHFKVNQINQKVEGTGDVTIFTADKMYKGIINLSLETYVNKYKASGIITHYNSNGESKGILYDSNGYQSTPYNINFEDITLEEGDYLLGTFGFYNGTGSSAPNNKVGCTIMASLIHETL